VYTHFVTHRDIRESNDILGGQEKTLQIHQKVTQNVKCGEFDVAGICYTRRQIGVIIIIQMRMYNYLDCSFKRITYFDFFDQNLCGVVE
jgi:hypothetical protein